MGERDAILLTLGAVAAAYATAFGATFQFDDAHTVVANADVHSWSAWVASMPGIRAATKASYVASHALSAAPWSYVLGSVLLHAASAAAVLVLALNWLRDFGLPPGRAAFAALVTALIFALHPAQTEAVTYVAGRSVTLAGFLCLASLLAYERWRECGARTMLVVSLAAFALALAARETAWTLPIVLVLVESARGRSLREAMRVATGHFGIVAVAAVAVAWSPTYAHLLRESFATRGPLDNLHAQVGGVAYLVTHPLATLRINFDPDVGAATGTDVHWWIAALALGAAIGLGMAALRRRPWLGFPILWFFLHLAPTNGLVARYDLVNDRHLYLALMGPAMLVAIGLAHLASTRARVAASAALCLLLGVATLVRNTDYRSEVALWAATVRASPHKSRPWNNLGWALQQAGDRGHARDAYARSLELDPHNFRARANLEVLQLGQ